MMQVEKKETTSAGLFISNMIPTTTLEVIFKFLEKTLDAEDFKSLEAFSAKRDYPKKTCKGYCFLYFKDKDRVVSIRKALLGKELLK